MSFRAGSLDKLLVSSSRIWGDEGTAVRTFDGTAATCSFLCFHNARRAPLLCGAGPLQRDSRWEGKGGPAETFLKQQRLRSPASSSLPDSRTSIVRQ